jgi:hypothetical protein
MKIKVSLLALIALLILPEIAIAVCNLSYQTYRYKSATFYVANAKKIRVTVYNSMHDIYPRCLTAWIKIDGKYINLDGLPYTPENWQQAWASTAPNCINCGYRIVSGDSGYADYDLEKYAPNGYTGVVEVRVSSDCYETEKVDPCFCWDVKVEVVEYHQPLEQYCYLDIYVKDQYKKPLNAYIYVDGSYLTYAFHTLKKVLVGSHTVLASRSTYNSDSKTVSCSYGETKSLELFLTPAQVCTPGEIKNRRCACSTQVAYEKCKNDGSGWEAIIENCSSGYYCENGYCVLNKDGWYDTGKVRCNLELECGYGTKEKEQEYKDYLSDSTYTVKQKRWVNIGSCYQGCTSGYSCEAGYCVKVVCDAGYVEEYRCYGNWVQKKFINFDCSSDWINWEYCSYGCSGGTCLPKYEKACKISLSVTTPENIFVDDVAKATVRIVNTGGRGDYVSLDVYVCDIDSCYRMSCDGYSADPKVYVSAQTTYVLSCNTIIKKEGSYKVKVSYSGCGQSGDAYSGVFLVKKKEEPKCVAGFLEEFKCEGKWKMQLYQNNDCSVVWGYVKHCTYGCENGSCLPEPEVKESLSAATETLSAKEEEFPITGLAFLTELVVFFVLVLLLLIVLLAWLLMKRKIRKRNKPEQFE